MKKLICVAASLFVLNLTVAFGQQPGPTFQQRLTTTIQNAQRGAEANTSALTKFDLDFPGGTPAALIKVIEKATGKPMNTIVSDEDANVQLPPLKMNHVDVAQLFQALEAASQKAVTVAGGPFTGSYVQQWTGYSFKTTSESLSDDSIWYFRVEKPSLPPVISSQPKVCRFYTLTPYLDRGFTVDDITTAIQTGWKMSGATPPPELNYHKETRLLIAYGEPSQLGTIENVLQSLPSSNATRNEIDRMKSQIGQLQDQTGQLQKKISTPIPPPSALPEEKSGK